MTFTDVFGGSTIYPSEVSYLLLTLDADEELAWPLENSGTNNPASRIIDVNASGSFTVTLPDATLTSAGQTLLFYNVPASASSFDIVDNTGVPLATVAVGEVWQLYLAATNTVAGKWRVFRYGASTATVQPATIAGYGITAISNLLSQSMPVTTFNSTPRTQLGTDRAGAFVWTGTGAGTLNLLAAATAGNNFFIAVRNAGGGDLTLDPSGAETIDGGASLALRPGDSAVLATDGLTWYSFGLGQQAVFAFDFTSIGVTGGTYTLTGSELNRVAYKFVGVLTSDAEIIIPSTIQQYWIDNATTGVFNLTVKTSGGTGVAIAQGTRGIYYCNGADLIDADTSTISLPVSAANGGTGQVSYTIGDLLYASAASTLSRLAGVATGNALLSGGVGTAPAWGKIGLTTHVSGTLGVPNGGTGGTTAADGRAGLGATVLGSNLFTIANPGAITFPRFNADNTVSALDAASFRTAIGVTGGSGTVTSVDLSMPSIFSVSGNPITVSGTLAVSLASQTQNLIFASPNGSSGAPTFRAIVTADIQSALPFATAAEVRTGTNSTKAVNPSALSGSAAFQTLTDAATTTWDLSAGYNARWTLAASRTLAVTNPIEGMTYTLLVTQDATGSRLVTWPASFNWGTTGAPTLTTTASKHDVITLLCTNAGTPTFDAFLGGKGF